MKSVLIKSDIKRGVVAALACLLLVGNNILIAQEPAKAAAAVARKSAYQQPAFYALCILAIVLLIYIRQLSKLFASVVSNYAKKQKENSNTGNTLMVLAIMGLFQFIPNTSHAGAVSDFLHDGFGSTAFNAIAIIIIFELIAILVLTSIINTFLRKRKALKPYVEEKIVPLWDKLNKSVAVEKEAAIMTGHDYDGIRELDNNLPPWWKYGFYLTIVWSVFYLGYYHVFAAGPLPLQELAISEQKAEAAMEEYLKNAANQVDETNVTFLSSESDIAEGKKLFSDKTCIACHGPMGGGGTGPNLTDDYWLHGGAAGDVFYSIKYGIPEKGMKSWKNEITPSQMAQIISYIHSIKGSNPPGAKEPQGELYTPKIESDSLSNAAADTLAAPVDTTKK